MFDVHLVVRVDDNFVLWRLAVGAVHTFFFGRVLREVDMRAVFCVSHANRRSNSGANVSKHAPVSEHSGVCTSLKRPI